MGSFIKQYERFPSIGPLDIQDLNEFLVKAKEDFDSKYKDKSVSNLTITDFNIIKTLGAGGFGKVILAELKEDKQLYAIKAADKICAVKTKSFRYVYNEKKILQSVNFPFIVCSKFFFMDFRFLYFAMQYVPGGDFGSYIESLYSPLSESSAQFYASQVILAFEYMHYLDLIHRDFKPSNVMFDVLGFIKLCDFGFTVKCGEQERAWTTVGTPGYTAPEIYLEEGYTCAVDWWALGITIFEMCNLNKPFYHKNTYKLITLTVNIEYEIPKNFSPALKDLIKNILVKDESKRIANKRKGASHIKKHLWFKTIDWHRILNRTVKAPYIPPRDDSIHLKIP